MVPVVDSKQTPLMPCSEKRARRLIEKGEATPFWNKGTFCIRLNREPSDRKKQTIAVGVDPGSKKEGFSVRSSKHTYLNLQADAVTWVKRAMDDRYALRSARRQRNTPYKARRPNRACLKDSNRLPPSTRARWDLKVRILKWLSEFYPITHVVVEDVCARSKKGAKKWNIQFAPLQIGKNWFYGQLRDLGFNLSLKHGWETQLLRKELGLAKSKHKMAETFSAHAVDAWVLAHTVVGGIVKPENTRLVCLRPLMFHRRELHRQVPQKGGVRPPYGGTRTGSFKRGTLVRHPRYGLTYIGGGCVPKRRTQAVVSLHDLKTGKRLSPGVNPKKLKRLTSVSWVIYVASGK